MSRNISRDQEWDLISALGQSMAMMIIDQLCAGILQRVAQPTVNNTQSIYAANNDYDEAIDGSDRPTPFCYGHVGIL